MMMHMIFGKSLRTLGLVALFFGTSGPLRAESMAATQMPIVVARDQKATRARLESNVLEVEGTLKEVGSPVPPEAVKSLDAVAGMTDYDAIGSTQTILATYALLSGGLNDQAGVPRSTA